MTDLSTEDISKCANSNMTFTICDYLETTKNIPRRKGQKCQKLVKLDDWTLISAPHNWISFYVTTEKNSWFKVSLSYGKRIYEYLNLRIICWHKPDSKMLIIGGLLCFVSTLPLLSQSLEVVVKEEEIVTKIGDNVQMICSAVSEKVGCSFTSPIGKFFFIVINFCSL